MRSEIGLGIVVCGRMEEGEGMNETIGTFILGFAFLYLIEGIDILIHQKTNKAYKISHVLYPLFMVCGMIYFIVAGVI